MHEEYGSDHAEEIMKALSALRVTKQNSEYSLHDRIRDALAQAGFACEHEKKLGIRCRIDFLCGSVGIEIKRGKPDRTRLLEQTGRYLDSPELTSLIVVTEKSIALPPALRGKPVYVLCLNRLWGIAL